MDTNKIKAALNDIAKPATDIASGLESEQPAPEPQLLKIGQKVTNKYGQVGRVYMRPGDKLVTPEGELALLGSITGVYIVMLDSAKCLHITCGSEALEAASEPVFGWYRREHLTPLEG